MKKVVFCMPGFFILLSCVNVEKGKPEALVVDTSAKKFKMAASQQNDTIAINASDTVALNSIHLTLFHLTEVQKAHKEILLATNGKHGVAMIDTPIKDSVGKYQITVGFNGDETFETRFIFYVDIITSEIKIEDFISGEKLSLGDYRKLNKAAYSNIDTAVKLP